MFDDKSVKLKKEQFVEAESVAYLIEDTMKRKMAFANTCTLFAFKNYVEKNNYGEEPVTNINLFRVPAVCEKYEISDLYLGNIRIDVRASFDGKVFPIPKIHIKNSIAADYYVVYMGTKNPLKCTALGYIKKEDLIFDSQDDSYYYISTAILNPINELKDELKDFKKEDKTFYETEHKLAQENFGAFLDKDLDDIKSDDLINHLLECEDCRRLFVEYSFLEDVFNTAVKYYPDLKEMVDINETDEEPTQAEEISAEEPVSFSDEMAELNFENSADELPIDGEENVLQDGPTEEAIADSLENSEFDEGEDFIDLSETTLKEDSGNEIFDEYTITENQEPAVIDEIDTTIEEPTTDDTPSEDNAIEDMPIESSIFDDNNEELSLEQEDSQVENNDNDDTLNISDLEIFDINNEQTTDVAQVEENNSIELDFNDAAAPDVPDAPVIEGLPIEMDADDISEEAKDALNNDAELQSILNEDSAETVSTDSNWNDLFAGNTKSDTPETAAPNDASMTQEPEEIKMLYEENEAIANDLNPDNITAQPTEKTDKTAYKNNVGLIVLISVLAVTLVAGGTFAVINNLSGIGNRAKSNNSIPDMPPLDGPGSTDINQSMTNAFNESAPVQISKVSWQTAPGITKNPDYKEYLTTLGSSIWDSLDEESSYVQSSTLLKETKIIIKINNGVVGDILVGESSGSVDIDNMIVQTVKKSTQAVPFGSFITSKENINLILVVNF